MTRRREIVTDHAVLRWLERVRGVGPQIAARFPDEASPRTKIGFGCHVLGITVDEAREEILPPRLRPGVEMGASRIIGADRALVCDSGRIVTCLAPDMYRARRPVHSAGDMAAS